MKYRNTIHRIFILGEEPEPEPGEERERPDAGKLGKRPIPADALAHLRAMRDQHIRPDVTPGE